MINSRRNLGSLSPGQRLFSLSAAIALNGAALMMLLLLRTPTPAKVGNAQGDSAMGLIAATPKSQKQPVVVKTLFRRNIPALITPPEVSAATTSSAPGTGAACPVLEDVAKGILADPVALNAIVHAPPEVRSVTDAIVVWNAAWAPATVPTTDNLQAPLGPVRANVSATLEALSEDCLSSTVTGPRLIAVPNGDRSMILVFGSGEWTWQTLIDPVPAEGDPAPVANISWLPGAFRYR